MPWGISLIHFLIWKKYWGVRIVKFIVLILALSVWLLFLFLMLQNYQIIFQNKFENLFLKFLGLLILIVALLIEYFTTKALSTKRIFGSSEFSNSNDLLITFGIYKYARHPRYIEHPFWALGFGLFFGFPFLIWLSLYLLISFSITAFMEEKELINRYGDKYLEYKKNTSAFFIV